MMRRLTCFAMLLMLGACQEELVPNPEPALPPELVAQEKANQDCVKAGGTPVINGFGVSICQVKTQDGVNPVPPRMTVRGSVWPRDKYVYPIAPISGALKLMKMGNA